jgi:hypothetical protein
MRGDCAGHRGPDHTHDAGPGQKTTTRPSDVSDDTRLDAVSDRTVSGDAVTCAEVTDHVQ